MDEIDGRHIEQLVLDESRDSQEKFKSLWEYYYPRLLVYARSFKEMVESERQDAVSDILLKAFDNLRKYKPIYSLSTWVYRIARNHIIDLYRKNKKNAPISIEELSEQTALNAANERGGKRNGGRSFVDEIVQNDSIERCRECIKSLEKQDQRIIFFRYYEGLNSKEIALIEGMPHNTVRRRLMLSKARIKKLLGDDYEH
ncbi:MAG: sigma-70 family RNA polymerase sigma factor [Treponema sp.]|jgi:RNA polymerase sigma-70 factor (ECF subfamily)|nr:sigma-70 family RNA polymerase sigma factor [Treponema sp.]